MWISTHLGFVKDVFCHAFDKAIGKEFRNMKNLSNGMVMGAALAEGFGDDMLVRLFAFHFGFGRIVFVLVRDYGTSIPPANTGLPKEN